MARSAWIDLLDPSEEELREHVAHELRADAWAELMRPADPEGRSPRPSVKSHGNYVLGLLLAAVAVPEEDVVYYQEVDFVLSRERIVTVRKTPGERPPFDPSDIGDVCDAIARCAEPQRFPRAASGSLAPRAAPCPRWPVRAVQFSTRLA